MPEQQAAQESTDPETRATQAQTVRNSARAAVSEKGIPRSHNEPFR